MNIFNPIGKFNDYSLSSWFDESLNNLNEKTPKSFISISYKLENNHASILKFI